MVYIIGQRMAVPYSDGLHRRFTSIEKCPQRDVTTLTVEPMLLRLQNG